MKDDARGREDRAGSRIAARDRQRRRAEEPILSTVRFSGPAGKLEGPLVLEAARSSWHTSVSEQTDPRFVWHQDLAAVIDSGSIGNCAAAPCARAAWKHLPATLRIGRSVDAGSGKADRPPSPCLLPSERHLIVKITIPLVHARYDELDAGFLPDMREDWRKTVKLFGWHDAVFISGKPDVSIYAPVKIAMNGSDRIRS